MFCAIAKTLGVNLKTLDIDEELKPNCVGSIIDLPFKDSSFDVVCAFQVLEHLPYEKALLALGEMKRICRNNVIISLPDVRKSWRFSIYLPGIGMKKVLIQSPIRDRGEHLYDGQHFWEINKKGYLLDEIQKDFSSTMKLIKTYRVFEYPYHRFFIFEK